MSRQPNPQLLNYLGEYDAHLASLTLALREIVLEEAPRAIESLAKGYALAIGFSFTGRPMKDGFCHIVTYSSHVNLGFNRGVLLPDPHGVLHGTGKLIRHITIRNHDDLNRPYVRRFLQAAIQPGNDTPAQSAPKSAAKKSNPAPTPSREKQKPARD